MFTQIDPLPGAQRQLPIGNRQHQTDAKYAAFEMSRHIVNQTNFCEFSRVSE
jgi:hypothetical protein